MNSKERTKTQLRIKKFSYLLYFYHFKSNTYIFPDLQYSRLISSENKKLSHHHYDRERRRKYRSTKNNNSYMRRQSGRSSSSSTVLLDVPGFTAMIFAEHTYSSAPLPGIHFLIMDFDSGFCVILTWTNPTDLRIALTSSGFAAPETQHAKASAVRRCLGISRIATTSAIASRPPGFKTRNASL